MPEGLSAKVNRSLVMLGLVSARSRTYRVLLYLSVLGSLRRRLLSREEVVVGREILAPGQFVRITALGPPPTRRERKRARRAAKRAGGGAVQD